MHLQVPLNRLKFGQEDGDGINARVVGREEGIAALAVTLRAQGQIEDLIRDKHLLIVPSGPLTVRT